LDILTIRDAGLVSFAVLSHVLDHISTLFDRRCRMQTALRTLKKLRQWVSRVTWMGET
jgi:hypothetical protein